MRRRVNTTGQKYNFPQELLVYLNLRVETYNVPFIMSDVLRKCEVVQNSTNRYNVPIELYRILIKDPGYTSHYNTILLRKTDIQRFVNDLKSEYADEYIMVTDVLSSNAVKQLLVTI